MPPMHKDLREIHMIGSRSREWRLAADACPAMTPCGILYAGWTDATAGYRFVRRDPQFHGLIICDAGVGEVLIDGHWAKCRSGQAYLLPRGTLHAYHAAGPWKVCWVAFDPKMVLAWPTGQPQLVKADPRPLRAALEGLQREINGPHDTAAMHHWVELIRLYGLRVGGASHRDARLYRLWEQVDSDLGHLWTLGELADLAGMSPEHLRRISQTQFGCSPMSHLARLRMRRAAALLVSSIQKITVIAKAVGYDNPFAFSSCFRRHLGLSPAAYRSGQNGKEENSAESA